MMMLSGSIGKQLSDEMRVGQSCSHLNRISKQNQFFIRNDVFLSLNLGNLIFQKLGKTNF